MALYLDALVWSQPATTTFSTACSDFRKCFSEWNRLVSFDASNLVTIELKKPVDSEDFDGKCVDLPKTAST